MGEVSNRLKQALAQLQPLAALPDWGIGGSLLLVEQQLQADFRDIDLVCTTEAAPALDAVLSQLATPLQTTPHPQYCSQFFRRYQHSSGLVIELMAGIAVRNSTGALQHWQFDPRSVRQRHGLPWMTLRDWLVLYQLFERPEKVMLIQAALARSADQD
jgi:hypothetical protein